MPVYGLTRGVDGASPKIAVFEVTGPSSYTSGGFTVAVDGFRGIVFAVVEAGGGYKAEVASISGNTLTVKVYYYNYPAGEAGPAVEVPAGTDLSSVSFKILVIGY